MAVFRVEKTKDFTIMSNHHLRNTGLSLKAKGLLSLMLSLPEDWDYTTKGLAHILSLIHIYRDKKEDRSAKDWLDDLNPEQKRMLGEMLKEFL